MWYKIYQTVKQAVNYKVRNSHVADFAALGQKIIQASGNCSAS